MKRLLLIAALVLMSGPAFATGFTLSDSLGKTHQLSDYKGKWVLVNFWATWCLPCVKEIPDFSALYDAHKGRDLMVLGVAIDFDNPKEVITYARKLSMSYPLILGDDKTIDQFDRVVGLPTSYLYDPKGSLVLKKVGTLPLETIETFLAGKK
jgi:thiol-disulfide isomerase/thioredoxin